MIKSFYEISDDEYFQQLENKLRDEIHEEGKDYLLSLNENECKSYLIDKYRLEKIEIFKSDERFAEPKKEIDTINDKYGRSIKRSVYHFTIEYPFSGDPSLFSVRPSQHSIEYKRIEVNTENNTVSIKFKLHKNDQDQFEIEKEKIYSQAFINLDSLNNSVERWNSLLPGKVDSFFDDIKEKLTEESKEPDKKVDIKADEKATSVPAAPPADNTKKKPTEDKEPDKEVDIKVDGKTKSEPEVSPVDDIKEERTESKEPDKKVDMKVDEKTKSEPEVSPVDDIKEELSEGKEPDKKVDMKVDEKIKSEPEVSPVDDIKEERTEEGKEPDKKVDIKVDEKTKSVFTVPPVVEKSIPKPSIEKGKEVAFDSHISKELYTDILNIIYDVGKKMEKKPSLYLDKDEEDLRDQFLLFLETRYEGVTGTDEIFNKEGTTDIILKYSKNGSNLFVAECKFWHGINVFKKVVNQLFDRYLTWKDSKVALLFFVTNKNFSSVLTELKQHISEHPYYKNYLGNKGDSSFAYKFHLPNHDDIEIDLEVMLFHFPHLD